MIIEWSLRRSARTHCAARGRHGALLQIVLFALVAVAMLHSPTVHSQTQSCGGSGQATCPPPAPVQCTVPFYGTTICRAIYIGPWAYKSGDTASAWFNSLADFDSWLISSAELSTHCSDWCVVGDEPPTAQRDYAGVLYNQNGHVDYEGSDWNGTTCVFYSQLMPLIATVQEYREVDCPDPSNWALVQESSGNYTCACKSGSDCSAPRCSKGGINKGDPCDISIGNMREEATDYGGPGPLHFSRTYNSLIAAQNYFGSTLRANVR
jgi:hypothetical protein